MKRFTQSQLAGAAVVVMMTLAGCSKPILDWRNAEVTDGLIYSPSANEPFTGVVTHVPDDFLFNNAPGYNQFMQEAGGNRYAVARFMQALMGSDSPSLYCRINVHKGFVDGDATCDVPRTETTVIEAQFDGGRLSGKFVYYNPDKPDQKLIMGRFDQGQPDGTQKIYSASTGKLVKKLGWSDGAYDGDYASYNETNGKVVIEGAFAGGKRTGRWKQYTADGEHLTAKLGYSKGFYDGVAESFDPGTGKRMVLVDKWVNGKIDGERKTWDKNGILLTDEVYVDGKLVNSKDVSTEPANQIAKALTGPISPSTSELARTAAPSTGTPASSVPPVSLDGCVQGWTKAHHEEAAKVGVDDTISIDQIKEWEDWCKAGKQAPAEGS
ncbi:hypothetical protein [Frateuria sp. Soil773]|uniref:toxin-antitoxin system YwqK family antitoxin n=1 Tax=Frateuria sp. Soil773 TaxID=1736407 RepID=UPI0012FA7C64|nr:hypothetical protein [Frateuria sp. Soil773]